MTIPDIRLENHGSIWLGRALTPKGREWFDDWVAVEQWFGGAAVIEWRYAGDIAQGARLDGLNVEIRQ
jgi:hypothetical protein